MKKTNLYEENDFSDNAFTNYLVHESPYFKILNFNFKPGQELPVHSHEIEGQLSIFVVEGTGEFLGKDDATQPARSGMSSYPTSVTPTVFGQKRTCVSW